MAFTHRFDPTVLREYDIRGIIGRTLGAADAFAIGRCFGSVVARDGGCMAVVGYDGRTVNYLRLFQARSSDDFDIDIFNRGDYIRAVEQKIGLRDPLGPRVVKGNLPDPSALRPGPADRRAQIAGSSALDDWGGDSRPQPGGETADLRV